MFCKCSISVFFKSIDQCCCRTRRDTRTNMAPQGRRSRWAPTTASRHTCRGLQKYLQPWIRCMHEYYKPIHAWSLDWRIRAAIATRQFSKYLMTFQYAFDTRKKHSLSSWSQRISALAWGQDSLYSILTFISLPGGAEKAMWGGDSWRQYSFLLLWWVAICNKRSAKQCKLRLSF